VDSIPATQNRYGLLQQQDRPKIYLGSDSVFLTPLNIGFLGKCSKPQIIKKIQLDGQGSPEYVIRRICNKKYEEHDALSDLKIKSKFTFIEIWDIDKKVLLFSNYTKLKSSHKGYENGRDPKLFNQNHKSKLLFDDQKRLIIRHSNQNEDIYSIENGTFKIIE